MQLPPCSETQLPDAPLFTFPHCSRLYVEGILPLSYGRRLNSALDWITERWELGMKRGWRCSSADESWPPLSLISGRLYSSHINLSSLFPSLLHQQKPLGWVHRLICHVTKANRVHDVFIFYIYCPSNPSPSTSSFIFLLWFIIDLRALDAFRRVRG